MSKSVITDSLLTAIADAIRTKTGSAATMTPADMATAIGNIPAGPEHYMALEYDRVGNIVSAEFVGIETIPSYVMHSKSTLAQVQFDPSTWSIGEYAFCGCTSLPLTSIPSGISQIEGYAFKGCTRTNLTELPQHLTIIGQSAFENCSGLTFTVLPDRITSIGATAFRGCGMTSITCDGAITTIGNYAFPLGITSASFPNMAASSISIVFGASTASNACKSLQFADIGKTKSIAANAFANCYALQALVLRRSDAICTLVSTNAFNNTPFSGYNSLNGTIYVPQALISTYQAATNWSTLYAGGHLTFSAIEGSIYE